VKQFLNGPSRERVRSPAMLKSPAVCSNWREAAGAPGTATPL